MAGTVNYLFDPNQVVYVIANCVEGGKNIPAVREGTVVRVRVEALVTKTTIKYDVQIQGQSGTTELPETDLFVDLATAVAEYQVRLTP